MKNGRKYQLEFVAGVLMFDGTVKLDGTVEFSTRSKILRDQIVSILKQERVHIWEFKRKITKWSSGWKYGFSSRSFNFFMKILKGPKKTKLEFIRNGKKITLEELLKLFPVREQSKIPFIKEIYHQVKISYPNPLHFRVLMDNIRKKYKVNFHRNTLLVYLNLLVKLKIIKRISRGWYKIA